ncbi:MAG: flavodoxin domain-containing protein [Burkholderiaceae bacterium]|nr:flavodoxin domain-containing protein [Sulfuritalea sp.]MCF8174522.1 flavodoxin domain-containing protein [Burkholderiaceae bacterium]
MSNILIIVGTESGNAQMCADHLADNLPALGHEVEVAADADAGSVGLDGREVVLVCTSTHGDGELPDNIIPLAERLRTEKPDLSFLSYGVIALGDQTYKATFCQAGKDMDALFAECGASKVGERLEIDACTQPLPDEEALTWAQEWVTML